MSDISPDMALVLGHLHEIDQTIAAEEAKLWEDIRRLQLKLQALQERILERKRAGMDALRPMRQQREAIVNQIARMQALSKVAPPFILKAGDRKP